MIVTMASHPDTKNLNKTVIKEGTGCKRLNDGAECTVNITIKGRNVSTKSFTIVMGDLDSSFSDLIETSLMSMAPEEIAEFDLEFYSEQFSDFLKFVNGDASSANSTGTCGIDETSKCENSAEKINVICEIELTAFKNSKSSYEMTIEEKYDRALHHKTLGTKFFQRGDIPAAFKKYSLALKYLICIHPEALISIKLLKDYQKLRSLCYLNLAACQLKYENFDHVIANCSKSLEYDQYNVKAFYRRGTANYKLGKLEQAKNDFNSGLKIQPNNSTLKQAIRQIIS